MALVDRLEAALRRPRLLVLGVLGVEIGKRGVALVETQRHEPGRAVALLGDVDLGDVLVLGRGRVVAAGRGDLGADEGRGTD